LKIVEKECSVENRRKRMLSWKSEKKNAQLEIREKVFIEESFKKKEGYRKYPFLLQTD